MRLGLFAFVVSLVLALAPRPPRLDEEEDQFLDQYRKALDIQDLRAINQMVQKDVRSHARAIADRIVERVCKEYANAGKNAESSKLEEIRQLATAHDEVVGEKRLQKRLDLLVNMKPEERGKWAEVRDAFWKAIDVFQQANAKADQAEFGKAAAEMADVVEQAAKIGDLETQSLAIYHEGYSYEQRGENDKVIDLFDKGMDAWVAAGRVKDTFYEHMKVTRATLMEQRDHGGGGNKPPSDGKPAPPDGEGAGGPAITSYATGSDWKEWTTEYHDMKDPFQFGATSPWCSEHLLLWREFQWNDGTHPLGSLVPSQPFGKPLNVIRDGSKGVFDVDNDGKEGKNDPPVKVIDGKATLNVAKLGDGKDAQLYSFWMLTGGQGQSWFGSPVNFNSSGRYRSGCYREGKILDETIVFLDENCSGLFGDPSDQGDGLTRGNPRFMDDDGLVIGKGKAIPWSDAVQIKDKWYHLKLVDNHAKKVRTRELAIDTGQVVVKWNGGGVPPKSLVLGEIRNFKGSYFDVAGGKPVTVPVGRYEIAYGKVETGKSAQTKLAWIFKGDSKAIDVKKDQVVTLDMGAPYSLDFEVKVEAKQLTVKGKSLVVREKSGAIIGRIYDEVLMPEVSVRPKGGAPSGKPLEMTRISSEVFNKDNNAAWFPADLEIKKAEKQELELQFNLKKHALLGGPFTSEWK